MNSFQFSWYGLILGFGVSVSLWIFEYILQKENNKKISEKNLFIGTGLVLMFGILGARLYHLVTDWHVYQNQPWTTWLATWNGGLGIYGGILGGLLGIIIWQKWRIPKVSLWKLLDSAVIVLPLGQAIGRFGNFINQELFGTPTTLPWGIFIPLENRPEHYLSFTHFHPLFLYEALPNLFLFFAFFLLWRWQKKQTDLSFIKLGSGIYVGLYGLCYGVVRFSLDFARWDLPTKFGTLTASQWVSLGLIGTGLWALSRFSRSLVAPIKKTTQKLILLGIVTGSFILTAPQNVSAQTQHELDLTIQPSVVELSIQPGKKVTQAIEISNSGTKDLEVTLSLRDFTSDNRTGSPVLLETSTFPYATLQNANIQIGEPFLLSADSTQQIVLALNVPSEAKTQDWYFVLLAETRSVADNNLIGSGASATGTIGTNLLVRVTPTEFLPTHWELKLQGIPKIVDSLQSVTIHALSTNVSNSLAQPDLSIIIRNWKGDIVYEELGLPDRVLAQSTREIFAGKQRVDDPRSYETVPFTFDPLFAIGPYTVHATIRNNEGGPVIVEQGFLALPISLFFGMTLIIGIFFALHAYRKSRQHPHDAETEELLKKIIP